MIVYTRRADMLNGAREPDLPQRRHRARRRQGRFAPMVALRPSLTAAARGASRVSGRGKETAPSRTKKRTERLDTPAAIRERAITAIAARR